MAIRILTGVISCGPPVGFVRIGFNPHLRLQAGAGNTTVLEMSEIGPARDFAAIPAKHVALRQLAFQRVGTASEHTDCVVNDTISATELRVSWASSADISGPFARIVAAEISYMIVGEVPDSTGP